MPDTAIQVEHLSKMYRLGVINNGALYQDIQSWIALRRGKEDPHSKIGGNKYSGDKDHFWALKDVSFDVKQGDRLGIIGKNGAGKSTLLKILSRITTPTEGTVKIKGKVTSLLEVGTGFHAELTGRENIYLNGAILGMKKRRIDEKLDSIIEFSGIEQHIDTPVKRYSSGMYVRLAFAVAAHLDSDILIADEVLAVGDAEFQKRALGKMQDLSTGEGRTVLFVSHNMGTIKNLCNFGIVIERGEIYSIGDIDVCISNYNDMFMPPVPAGIESERYYEPDDTKPFQINKIEILNEDGKQCSVYEAQKELIIRLHFISRKQLPNVYCYFHIKKKNGENFIRCYSTEDGHDIFNNMPSGKYIIELTIMKGLLSCGEYAISLGFGCGHLPGGYGEQYWNALRFNVVDSLSLIGNTRNAIVSAVLEWKIIDYMK